MSPWLDQRSVLASLGGQAAASMSVTIAAMRCMRVLRAWVRTNHSHNRRRGGRENAAARYNFRKPPEIAMNAVVETRPAVPALKDPNLFRDRCLVDGQWVEADSRARIQVDNPADGSLVG